MTSSCVNTQLHLTQLISLLASSCNQLAAVRSRQTLTLPWPWQCRQSHRQSVDWLSCWKTPGWLGRWVETETLTSRQSQTDWDCHVVLTHRYTQTYTDIQRQTQTDVETAARNGNNGNTEVMGWPLHGYCGNDGKYPIMHSQQCCSGHVSDYQYLLGWCRQLERVLVRAVGDRRHLWGRLGW